MMTAVAEVGSITVGSRPMPPDALADELAREGFAPDKSLEAWIRHHFIREGGTLSNPDHAHLEYAHIGVLWTNVPNRHQQRWIAGTAECPQTQGNAWKRGRGDYQLRQWFSTEPDFLITLYAPLLAKLGDRDFCMVIEHELYHCAQDTTRDGSPRFHRDGRPMFAIRGHDVEEFIGVVRRYGARGDALAFTQAARRKPTVRDPELALACGTCAR